MTTIHKWKLLPGPNRYLLPEGAELLTVQVQNGEPYFWARINTDAELVERKLEVVGTGFQTYPGGRYLATFQLDDGALVFHVFDRGEG